MSAMTEAAAARPSRRRPSEPIASGLRARLRLPSDMLWSRIWYDLRAPLFGSRLYRLLLPTRVAVGPTPVPLADSWPGDAARGGAITQGVFAFGGQSIRDPAPLWLPVGARLSWLEELHGFEWLRDLRAASGDAGRRTARELVNRWLDDYRDWDALAWRPDLIGRRLAAWVSHYEFLGVGADALFRGRFLRGICRQASHLGAALPGGLGGSARLAAIGGLIHAGLALPRGTDHVARGRRLLERELARQFLDDGGHRERSPSALFAALRLLTGLRSALTAAEQPLPDGLDDTIRGMTQVLRLFQHGDGRLALFNDSNEEEDWLVDMALGRANGRALPLKEGVDSGFERLVANRTLVLVDGGAPPPPGFDHHAHAGTLAFEMSVGRERLIVNCGAHGGRGDWWRAQRSTAAHSTLVVDDTNSCVFAADGGLVRGPRAVACRRHEAEGNVWLELSHDGYRQTLDLIHHRRLFLSGGGDELRGEDRLVGAGRGPFAIRFHLHPDVSASLAQNGQTVLLRLASGSGWRLRAMGGAVRLSDSVYLGRRGEIRKTQQAVVAGDKGEGDAVVKWAIARESKPAKRH